MEKEGNYWVATIDAIDDEIIPGGQVEFTVYVDGQKFDNNGKPWSYQIREYAEQEESKHTKVVKNMFDPNDIEVEIGPDGKTRPVQEDMNKAFHLIYDLNRESFVNVSVYSVRGDIVRQLVNEVQGVGRYDIPWDGRNDAGKNVAMGLYLINIETIEYGDIRKIIVIIR